MKHHETEPAVIYCRTASRGPDGSSAALSRQEAACRAYADRKGYRAGDVFVDDGVSGMTSGRRALQAMLSFLDENPDHVVIVEEVSRLARCTDLHLELHEAVEQAGCRLESPGMAGGAPYNAGPSPALRSTEASHGDQ